jgi:hypothetical protein
MQLSVLGPWKFKYWRYSYSYKDRGSVSSVGYEYSHTERRRRGTMACGLSSSMKLAQVTRDEVEPNFTVLKILSYWQKRKGS